MPARVTSADVNAVLDVQRQSHELFPAIRAANLVVDEELAGSNQLSDKRLLEIERYLAAHFATLTQRPGGGVTSLRLGDSTTTYAEARSSMLGSLTATPHGEAAVALDSSGRLREMGKPRSTFAVL